MKTAAFATYTGPGRISIARFAPRNTPKGFRIYKPLAPGPWFNSVPEAEYRKLYFEQLGQLDAKAVVAKLNELAAGSEPVLLCYERYLDCKTGKTYCHRHMVAEWLKNTLWLDVPEVQS